MLRDSSKPRQSLSLAASATQISEAHVDDRTIELINDDAAGRLKLIWFDGVQYQTADRIDIGGRTFVPLTLDPGIQAAIPLPTTASDYGTTEKLFAETREVLSAHGMPQEVAAAATHYNFSTWFPESGAPLCMTITGPSVEATLLLQLLGCIVRRGLLIIEIDSSGFRGLINNIHPTLLVDARNFTPCGRRKLMASYGPHTYVPWKGTVANFSCARAVYLGAAPVADFSPDFSLHVHITPSHRGLFFLDEKKREQIIEAFQPRFLDYRLRNLDRVRASGLELPEMDSEGQIIGRILGGCIVDAPGTQAGVRSLLKGREGQLRAARWTDSTCVIIEALLNRCHRPGCDKIHVGEITEVAYVILKGRGAPAKLTDRRVGPILRRLGFDTKPRDSRGYYILVTPEVARRIHHLGRDYEVAAVEDGFARCPICRETFGVVGRAARPAPDLREGESV